MTDEELQHHLRLATGRASDNLRRDQLQAIRAILNPPRRALVIQATGWGKSMVYFLATKALRAKGLGPTLVISPLLSLMRNQIEHAERAGLVAGAISSDETVPAEIAIERARDGTLDILFVAPERLQMPAFRELLQTSSLGRVALVVVDEAHCISEWGHDFRPDYQAIRHLLEILPPNVAVLATTATANTRVEQDILEQLGGQAEVIRGTLKRKSLRLQTMPNLTYAERLAWLSTHIPNLPGSGIIYTLSVPDTTLIADWLTKHGIAAEAYSAALTNVARADIERRLIANSLKVVVATVALGMGFDKTDLHFVVHYECPGNLITYYQQVGRAGRRLTDSIAVALSGEEENRIHNYFITSALPTDDQIRQVLGALDEGPMTRGKLEYTLNARRGDIEKCLKYLQYLRPSPITSTNGAYSRSVHSYEPSRATKELEQRKYAELHRMKELLQSNHCLMEQVQRELNDPDATPCGRCAACLGTDIVPRDINPDHLQQAKMLLYQRSQTIEPRKMWPAGAFSNQDWQGRISDSQACDPGVCLSLYNRDKLGQLVAVGKSRDQYPAAVVEAAVAAARTLRPTLVTFVPSFRNHQAVSSLANQVADALQVPFLRVIRQVRETLPQKEQLNSNHQARNRDGAFQVENSVKGRVLLVDDMVDSGWTFTVLGALLRDAGAAAVLPLALASTKGKNDE